MIGQKADVIFQVAGLSGAGALEAACATPGVIGIGVDVDQSKSLPAVGQVHRHERREEARRRGRRGDQARSGPRPTSAAPPSGTPRPTPVGVGLSAVRQRPQGPRHPGDPGQGRRGPRRDEGRDRRSLQADRLRQQVVGRPATHRPRTGRQRVGPFSLSGLTHRATRCRRVTEATPRRSTMRGITKRYPGVLANDAHRSRPAARRDPRAARRERRRQVDPDEHPLRAGRARRGRDPARRQAGRRSSARTTPSTAGSAWSTSTSCSSRS